LARPVDLSCIPARRLASGTGRSRVRPADAHHIAQQLAALGHDVRLIPAKYVKPFLKGHKNDYRDAEAIAEAVQRPTMRFVAEGG
jgi:transposase